MNDSTASLPSVLIAEISSTSGHRIGRATLNAPASLNALSIDMIEALAPAIDRWAADPGIVAVMLDGAGDKAFCAGGNVGALYHGLRATPPGALPELAGRFFEHEYRLDHRLHTFPKPLLCWAHGIVMGGGVGLMVGASHRVVTPRTRLAMPEITIGLFPDVGGSRFLAQVPGKAGLFMALTAAQLNASDVRVAGLADFALDADRKAPVLEALANAGWTGNAAADHAVLTRLLASQGPAHDMPASNLLRHRELIEATVGHDSLAEAGARIAALASHDDPWLAQAAAAYRHGSPTTAALSWALQQRARHLSLADVFRLEHTAALACCAAPDFREGVRALLIDKDRQPRWQPAALADVNDARLAAYFTPRHDGPHPLGDLA